MTVRMKEDLKVVRRRQMRIDCNLIPIRGRVIYSGVQSEIVSRVKDFIGVNYKVDVEIEKKSKSCRGSPYSFYSLTLRRFKGNKLEEQLRDGDPCYIIIRAKARGGFGFVHDYPGDDWDRKFYNARQSLIQELNCTFYDEGKQLLITRLHPSQDARLLVDLLKSSAQLPPTIILQGLPPRWCYPSYQQSLESFLRSLAQISDIDMDRNYVPIQAKSYSMDYCKFNRDVSIQFENYDECYKALKKLCSHYFKEKEVGCSEVEYELTLKDESLVPNDAFDEVLVYQSDATQALNIRVAMLEKEFNTVKDLMENSEVVKGSSMARALYYRAAMLEKRLDTVKSVMKGLFGAEGYNEESTSTQAQAQALQNQVSMLNEKLSTLKSVLEDLRIGTTQTLEIRVAMLEKELKRMRDVIDNSPTDQQALKRCKSLTMD